jgi:hypothetical protein
MKLPNEVQASHKTKTASSSRTLCFAFTNTQKQMGNTDNLISHEDFVSYEWDDVLEFV